MDIRKKAEIVIKHQKMCERESYYLNDYEFHTDNTLIKICETVDEWINKTELADFLSSLIDDALDFDFYESLTEPLSVRKWAVSYDNRGAVEKRDIIYLRGQKDNPYYVYVHDCVQGTYGRQFEVAVNGGSTLYLLPTIKQFTDELEVGKCFIVTLRKEVSFGNNRKKYVYDIEEISEEQYLDGVIDARINTFAY